MSSKLHNKFHRHNHHSTSVGDPRYPDATHDPIASTDNPFQGPFILSGPLSASGFSDTNSLSSLPTAYFNAANAPYSIQTDGDVYFNGNVTITGGLSAGDIVYTQADIVIPAQDLNTTSEFLQLNINGAVRYIRLWN